MQLKNLRFELSFQDFGIQNLLPEEF